jgi:hypothetical protein
MTNTSKDKVIVEKSYADHVIINSEGTGSEVNLEIFYRALAQLLVNKPTDYGVLADNGVVPKVGDLLSHLGDSTKTESTSTAILYTTGEHTPAEPKKPVLSKARLEEIDKIIAKNKLSSFFSAPYSSYSARAIPNGTITVFYSTNEGQHDVDIMPMGDKKILSELEEAHNCIFYQVSPGRYRLHMVKEQQPNSAVLNKTRIASYLLHSSNCSYTVVPQDFSKLSFANNSDTKYKVNIRDYTCPVTMLSVFDSWASVTLRSLFATLEYVSNYTYSHQTGSNVHSCSINIKQGVSRKVLLRDLLENNFLPYLV